MKRLREKKHEILNPKFFRHTARADPPLAENKLKGAKLQIQNSSFEFTVFIFEFV
jgi:hypothetical protein